MTGLFGFLKRDHVVRSEPCVPEGTRVYAVGDIHGRADLLKSLFDLIRQDGEAYRECRKVLVFVGDYVDRGMESRKVIDLVLDSVPKGFEVITLKGNHEALMLDFLADRGADELWLRNGGNATLYSYGIQVNGNVTTEQGLDAVRHDFACAVPSRHVEFLNRLKMTHVEGDYLFVHAGIHPDLSMDEQSEDELLWIREEFLASTADHGKVVVHGHSISRSWEPEIRANRIGIDTGAFVSGVLTCLVLQGIERTFLQTGD